MKIYTQGMAVRYTAKHNPQLPFGTIGSYNNDLGAFAYVIWDNGLNCQVNHDDIERVITQQQEVLLESKPDRTMIAAMAMQGLISSGNYHRSNLPQMACEIADELIRQLNKTEK
jgi:hypothetical protein